LLYTCTCLSSSAGQFSHMHCCDHRIVLQPKEIGLPFTAYTAIDEVREVSSRGWCKRLQRCHSFP
jgi:hypothetical protein